MMMLMMTILLSSKARDHRHISQGRGAQDDYVLFEPLCSIGTRGVR
jgi:hypothetical protein